MESERLLGIGFVVRLKCCVGVGRGGLSWRGFDTRIFDFLDDEKTKHDVHRSRLTRWKASQREEHQQRHSSMSLLFLSHADGSGYTY